MRLLLFIIAVVVIGFIIWDHKNKTKKQNCYVNNKKSGKSVTTSKLDYSIDTDSDDYTLSDLKRDIERDIRRTSSPVQATPMKVSRTTKPQHKVQETREIPEISESSGFERDWSTVNALESESKSDDYDLHSEQVLDRAALDNNYQLRRESFEPTELDFAAEFATAITSGFEDEKTHNQVNTASKPLKPRISKETLSRNLGINIDTEQFNQFYNNRESLTDNQHDKTTNFDDGAVDDGNNLNTNTKYSQFDSHESVSKKTDANYANQDKANASKGIEKVVSQTSHDLTTKVYTVYVRAKNNSILKGEDLLQALLSVGCRYGDMNIFHRYEKGNGQGRVMFSIASMIKPGTLNIDIMQELAIPGVALFFTYPGTYEPLTVYDLMMKTANQLAKLLDADILDEHKEILTSEKALAIRAQIEALEIQEFF